jgi:hypothetical protein
VPAIDIDPRIEEWLEQAVFQAFAGRGIEITPPAKNIIAYTVQAQAEEDTPPHLRTELERLQSQMNRRAPAQGTFFENAAGVFLELYPSTAVLNVNRAVRLMAEIYFRRFGGFPCGPSRGGRSGSGSRGGGRKTAPSELRDPAVAGA